MLRFTPDLQHLLDSLSDGFYYVDRQRTICFWNRTATRITGFNATQMLGTHCQDNLLRHVDGEGIHLCTERCPLVKAMEENRCVEADVYLHHQAGHRLPVRVRICPVHDASGTVVGATELFSDLSEKTGILLQLEELRRLALIDPLTGLINRTGLEREMEVRLQERYRYDWPLGVLFFDIDHFKQINDTYGHDLGDEVLRLVGNTLKSNCRPFDTFCRWGGEEFVGLLRNVDATTLCEVAERIRMLVEESFTMHNGERIGVTISIGATLGKMDDSSGSLIKRADRLMYQSKQEGRNRITCDVA